MNSLEPSSSEDVSLVVGDEVPNDLRQTNAFQVLDQLFKDKIISPQQAEKYTRKLAKLHEGILKTYRSEKDVLKQVQNLKEELNEQKEQLKKSGTQSFEDNSTISNLKKDLLKIQSEVTLCGEREENERLEISTLEKQKKELEDLVEQERRRKVDELEPVIQSLKTITNEYKEEIDHQRIFIEKQVKDKIETEEKIQKLLLDKTELDNGVIKIKQEFSKIKADPEKYRKQADVSQTALKTLKIEADRLNTFIIELDSELNNQARKRKEDLDNSMNLAVQLDKYRNLIDQKEKQCNEIIRDSEIEEQRQQVEQENRAKMEMELKKCLFTIRRKNEEYMGKEREMNNALKSVRRAKYSLEATKRSIPELQNKIEEMKRELEKEQNIAKRQHTKLEELRCDRDILINNFLKQEDLEKGREDVLKLLITDNTEHEEELNRLMKQELSLNREMLQLGLERAVKQNEAVKAAYLFEKARDELKLKNLLIVDLEKVYADSDTHLKKYEGLYEIVKNERNKYANLLQTTQLISTELTEKMKILQNEIDILKNESVTKDKALMTEQAHYQAVCIERDSARGEINKSSYMCQIKEETVDQGIAEIRKLNTIIRTAESEMLMMRKRYEAELEHRNRTGMLLVQGNEELSLLYEKCNLQENILRNGDIELQKREEEIRILNLHIAELAREIDVLRKMEQRIPKLQNEKDQLIRLLREKQEEALKLSNEIESPANQSRWRSLAGEELNQEELSDKITKLEDKISHQEEKLLQKETTIQEAMKMEHRIVDQIKSVADGSKQLAQQINEKKSQIKEINRKIMSLLAQLSLNTALSIKLKQEKQNKEIEVKEGYERLQRGEPPNTEAERNWVRDETVRTIRDSDKQARKEYLASLNFTPAGTLTTAQTRVTMYLPEGTDDGFAIPKPYGIYAPYKPSEIGTNRRHIKKPKPRELVL